MHSVRVVLLIACVAAVALAATVPTSAPSYDDIERLPVGNNNIGTAAVPPASTKNEPSVGPAFATFLSISGPFFFGLLQLSGLSQVREIKANKSTGSMSVLPFLSLVVNGEVWCLYGLLLRDVTIYFPNATCVLLGLYYTYVFDTYKPAT